MKALYFVFGIVAFAVGILCLVNPFESFLAIGIIVAVFLLLVGLFFIMMFFMGRKTRTVTMDKPAVGIAGLLLGIAMVVLAVLSLAVPSIDEALDMVILIVFAVWMIFNGLMSIFTGAAYRRQAPGQGGMVLMVVLGVIVAAAGVYGLFHLAIFEEALGMVLGFLLMLYGVDLICGAFTDPYFGGDQTV